MADPQVVVVQVPVQGKRGPRGIQGQTGATGVAGADGAAGPPGLGSIASTTNLIKGDGAGAGIDAGITAAAVSAVIANNTGTSSGTNTGDQTDIPGNAGTVTTIPDLTGDVISSGVATTLFNIPKEATRELDPLGVSLETGGWLEYEVTVNDAYTGQTYQDIAELVSDVLSTSARYELQALLKFSVSADATGMRIGLHGGGSGSAATALAGVLATSTNPTNAATFIIKDPDASANTILASASVIGIVLVWGFVTTRSGGSPTISIQHLKVTSGTVTCLPGSKMRLRKCGA